MYSEYYNEILNPNMSKSICVQNNVYIDIYRYIHNICKRDYLRKTLPNFAPILCESSFKLTDFEDSELI